MLDTAHIMTADHFIPLSFPVCFFMINYPIQANLKNPQQKTVSVPALVKRYKENSFSFTVSAVYVLNWQHDWYLCMLHAFHAEPKLSL